MEIEKSPSVFNIVGGLMTVTTVFSFVFNACGLVILAKNMKLLSPTTMFVMALCACDLFMCAPALIVIVACFRQWSSFNGYLCVFQGFLTYFFGLTSIYLMAALSLDRYIIMTKPILATKLNKRTSFLCIVVCFLLALVISVAPLAGWNAYTLEGIGISCSITWQTYDASALSFVIFIFIVCFILPISVMIFCYASIYCTLYKVSTSSQGGVSSSIRQTNMAVEKKVLFTCVVLVSVFVIAWAPYAVVSFMSAFGYSHLITPTVATIPAVIAKTSGIWNPIVYLATNKKFRNLLSSIILCPSLTERLRNRGLDDENEAEGDVINTNTVKMSKASPGRYQCSQIFPAV